MCVSPIVSDISFAIERHTNCEVVTRTFDTLDGQLADFLSDLFVHFVLTLVMDRRDDLAAV